jgi:hypothetical protein
VRAVAVDESLDSVSDLQTHKVSLGRIENLKGKARGLRARVLVSQTSESELEKKRLRDDALDDGQQRWATQTTTQRGEDKGDRYCRVRDDLETRELTTRQATIYTVSRVHRPFVHIYEAVPIEELGVFQNVLD